MKKINAFMGRYMAQLVVSSVLLGIFFPTFFSPLSHFTMALFAFMTFANSLDGGFREMKNVICRPLPVVAVFSIQHIVMPLLALGIGSLLFQESPMFTTGLVLEFVVPTGVASLMWVAMGRGNTVLTLSMVLLDTLLSPLVIPLSLRLLLGSVVKMDTWGMMRDLLIMVAIPALLAMTLYQISGGRVSSTLKPRLAPFAKCFMLLVVLSNATGCASYLRSLTPTLALVIVTVISLALTGYFLGYWAGHFLGVDFPTQLSMSLNSGMRNIAAGAVLATEYFPGDAVFPVAFSPLFFQAVTSVIVKLLHATKPGRAFAAKHQEPS